MIIANPYARGLCRAIDNTNPAHIHRCTGPAGHGGGEHICGCEVWWKSTGTPVYADHPPVEDGAA